MKKIILACAVLFSGFAMADAVPGETAPAFEVKDANGKSQKLADYKGKWLVLEWFNKDCPFVKKHYGSKNMQKVQKESMAKNVAWLTVNSSAKGKEGYADAKQTLADFKALGSKPTAMLLDETGVMGKAYGAKTTPHMFVINPEQKVVYAGAIDNNPSSDPAVIAESTNYVTVALNEAMVPNGKVTTASSRPYGCGVKYKE